MSKQGKILRLREWRLGEKMQGGRGRHERYIDVVQVAGDHYICRHRHRATHRTHPYGKQGGHYWRLMQVPQYFHNTIKADFARIATWQGDRPVKVVETWERKDADPLEEMKAFMRELRQKYPPEEQQRRLMGGFRPQDWPSLSEPEPKRDVVALYEQRHPMPIVTDHMQMLPIVPKEVWD